MKKIILQISTISLSAIFLLAFISSAFIPLFQKGSTALPPAIDTNDPQPDLPELPDQPENSEPPIEPPASLPDESPAPPAPEAPVLPPEPEVPQEAVYVRAKVNGLNLRSGPGTKYSVVGNINKGDMVTYIAEENGWYTTMYKNKKAYLSSGDSFTETISMPLHENSAIENVIQEGLKLLGFPYVYGAIRLHDGSGKKLSNFDSTKYDCSSLMQYIYYYGADINLNMTTRTQVKQGTYVQKSKIKRGDLIFFTNSQRYYNTGVERIGHVALYLGNNYILHTASDYAVIEEISSTRWSYYIETRRFLD